MSETDEARVRRYADAARPYFGDAAARAVIAVADEEQAARWEELKELAQQVADTRRRAETAEAEVERLTRECLDREATETDARERLRRAEERLAAIGEAVKDLTWKASQYGQTEDDDTFAYIVPKGTMHRLIGTAQGAGIAAAFRSKEPGPWQVEP